MKLMRNEEGKIQFIVSDKKISDEEYKKLKEDWKKLFQGARMKPVLSNEFKEKIRAFLNENIQAYGIKITPTLLKQKFCPTRIMLKIEFINQRDEVVSWLDDVNTSESDSVILKFDKIIQHNIILYDEDRGEKE